jgi:hypothetical protein
MNTHLHLKPRSRFWRWTRNALITSLVIHVIAGIVAAFIVAYRLSNKPQAQFQGDPPPRPSLQPRKMEMRVKVQDLQRRSARPRLQPRMIAMAPSQIAIPEIKKDPNAKRTKVARDVASLGISGFGAGIGGGLGDGFGGGMGGGLPMLMADRCSPQDRSRRLQLGGAKAGTEGAILKGLRWLQKSQNADGSWGKSRKIAMTGLALLAYLGHCETPESPEFGQTVRKGIMYLVGQGKDRGNFIGSGHSGVYEHAIATYALAEAYTLTRMGEIVPVLEPAVQRIIQGMNGQDGWVYSYASGDLDVSVSGWQIQALKAAWLTGLNISDLEPCLDRAMRGILASQHPSGDWKYRRSYDRPKTTLTGVGVLCLQFWKHGKTKQAELGVARIVERAGEMSYSKGGVSLYDWYYSAQACFQHGGQAWGRFNSAFSTEVLRNQNPDGSWRQEGGGQTDQHGGADGLTYRTCLCILMLEVYYRYLPSFG